MAGNFTKLIYDDQAYSEKLYRSTDPLKYRLDPNYAISCNKCFAPHSPSSKGSEVIEQRIDVDSILRGVAKKYGKSIAHQSPESLDKFQTHFPKDCSNFLESEYSRYTHPSFDIRGLNVKDLRMDYPLHDPQCHIFENFAINTRLQAKDNHRAIWQIPMDQTEFFSNKN
ncbi:MAG: hypothetical protein QW303_02185 [Nitrososphaerota archaeon]